MAGKPLPLRACLYDVDQNGKSSPTWPESSERIKTVHPGRNLHVCVGDRQDSPFDSYLKIPSARGMAPEPIMVSLEAKTRHWIIRNSCRTNTLRFQQYGLLPISFLPQSPMPMTSENVAVWIPIAPRPSQASQTHSFRLLILSASLPDFASEQTPLITVPQRHLSPAVQEALIAYFGNHLSWPPLPAPHVRQEKEVRDIAHKTGLQKPEHWARNRHDVLTSRDGLFTGDGWYPREGAPKRSLPSHLSSFHRLVELRTITLDRVQRWTKEHKVTPYVTIDEKLLLRP